ncbi:MAG: nucleotidyltransferase family protein, partial [Dehalococcoidia bacterium]
MQPRNMPDMQTGGTRVAAVLLAAGESSRMGRMKALLPWRDEEPLVAYQARTLHAAGYGPIIIVLGHKAGLVASVLPMDVPASTVFNKHYRQGRSTSITAGVRAVASTPPDALLVTSVDQPRSVAMLRALREAWEQERPALAVPSLDGRGGHPPLFAGTLIP